MGGGTKTSSPTFADGGGMTSSRGKTFISKFDAERADIVRRPSANGLGSGNGTPTSGNGAGMAMGKAAMLSPLHKGTTPTRDPSQASPVEMMRGSPMAKGVSPSAVRSVSATASTSTISFTPNPRYTHQSKALNANGVQRSVGEGFTPRMVENASQTLQVVDQQTTISSKHVSELAKCLEEGSMIGVQKNIALQNVSEKDLMLMFEANYKDIMSYGCVPNVSADARRSTKTPNYSWQPVPLDENVDPTGRKASFDEFEELRQIKSPGVFSPRGVHLQRSIGPDPLAMLKGRQAQVDAPVDLLEQPFLNLINSLENKTFQKPSVADAQPNLVTLKSASLAGLYSCISPQSNGTSLFFDISQKRTSDHAVGLVKKRLEHISHGGRIITPRKSARNNTTGFESSLSPRSSASNSSFMQSPRSAFVPAANSSRSSMASYRSAISETPPHSP